jgi:hypothetical protein
MGMFGHGTKAKERKNKWQWIGFPGNNCRTPVAALNDEHHVRLPSNLLLV